MHTIWSDCIQGIGTLYASRSLRFSDDFKEKYMSAFGLEDGRKILEIGSGQKAMGCQCICDDDYARDKMIEFSS